ncbi:MAG: hypothetical protein ACRD8U_06140, partial [Pyrinomonadaceae bacterium]
VRKGASAARPRFKFHNPSPLGSAAFLAESLRLSVTTQHELTRGSASRDLSKHTRREGGALPQWTRPSRLKVTAPVI